METKERKIDVGTMFRRMVVDEITITALVALLNSKGVDDSEIEKHIDGFVKKISEDEWKITSQLAYDSLPEVRGGDA